MEQATQAQPTEKPQPKIEEQGDKTTLSLIDKANQTAERLENANKEQAKLLERMEALEARRRLGGETGFNPPTPVKEETPAEYTKRILKGQI